MAVADGGEIGRLIFFISGMIRLRHCKSNYSMCMDEMVTPEKFIW